MASVVSEGRSMKRVCIICGLMACVALFVWLELRRPAPDQRIEIPIRGWIRPDDGGGAKVLAPFASIDTERAHTRRADEVGSERISSIAFVGGGDQIASAGSDGLLVWDVGARGLAQRLMDPLSYRQRTFCVSPDLQTIQEGDNSAGSQWRNNTGHWEELPGRNIYTEWWCQCMAYSPNGNWLAVGQRKTEGYQISLGPGDSFPRTFDLYSGFISNGPTAQNVSERFAEDDIVAISFSIDSRFLAVASVERRGTRESWIHLLDLSIGGRRRRSFSLTTGDTWGPGSITSLAFSPHDYRLAIGMSHGTGYPIPDVLIVDLITGQVLHALSGQNDRVNAIAFSPSGNLLLTAGADNMIRCWDAQTARPVHTLKGHTGPVTALAFSPDGGTLASGGEDGMIRLWNLDEIPGAGRTSR
jgi:WD40 repeat protein